MTKANFTGYPFARYPHYPREPTPVVIRSLVLRNALSAVLLVVALAGIVVQLREIRSGFIFPQTRLVLVAYIVIALYAAASIAVRIAARGKR